MSIPVHSVVLPKIKRFSLPKLNTKINLKEMEALDNFFDDDFVTNFLKNSIKNVNSYFCQSANSQLNPNALGIFVTDTYHSLSNKLSDLMVDFTAANVKLKINVASKVAMTGEEFLDRFASSGGKIVDAYYNAIIYNSKFFSSDYQQKALEKKNNFDDKLQSFIANQTFFSNDMKIFYDSYGSYAKSSYAYNQGALESLCTYEYIVDGKVRECSYREAKALIKYYGEYGLPLPRFRLKANSLYLKMQNHLISKGFTETEAHTIISSLNDPGACSYANFCNILAYQFRNDPESFEQMWGIPLSVYQNGQVIFNVELMLDLYVFANSTENGGTFFTGNHINESALSNNVDVLGNPMYVTEDQVYISHFGEPNAEVINKYLQSKSSFLKYDWDMVMINDAENVIDKSEFNKTLDSLKVAIREGSSISLYYAGVSGHTIRMFSCAPFSYSDCNLEKGAHIVTITGYTNDSFIISSWGEKYEIPFEDLINGGCFSISTGKIVNDS